MLMKAYQAYVFSLFGGKTRPDAHSPVHGPTKLESTVCAPCTDALKFSHDACPCTSTALMEKPYSHLLH
jgi:hypothetical protein